MSGLWRYKKGQVIQGGHCAGVPPLPIPNREVKPGCADGTAQQCGRVGGRRLYGYPPRETEMSSRGGFSIFVPSLFSLCLLFSPCLPFFHNTVSSFKYPCYGTGNSYTFSNTSPIHFSMIHYHYPSPRQSLLSIHTSLFIIAVR